MRNFPPFFVTIKEISEAERTNRANFSKILAKIIEKDPGLSADILKIANSPLYGFVGEIKSVMHAISLLGAEPVKNMVIKMATVRILDSSDENEEQKSFYTWFVKKSILNGIIFNISMKVFGIQTFEGCTETGLLMRIGQLYLSFKHKNRYPFSKAMNDSIVLDEEEKSIGKNFINVGLLIANSWKFPSEFSEAIKNQLKLFSQTDVAKVSYITNMLSEIVLNFKENNNALQKFEEFIVSNYSVNLIDYIDEIMNYLFDEINSFKEFGKLLKGSYTTLKEIKDYFTEKKDSIAIEEKLQEYEKETTFFKKANSTLLFLSKSLIWNPEPEATIKKLLYYLNDREYGWECRIIFWDYVKRNFYEYFLKDMKIEKRTFNIKRNSDFERSFLFKEVVIIKNSQESTIFTPVFSGHKVYGVIQFSIKNKDYSIEILKFIESVSKIVALSFNVKEIEDDLRKEINKKHIVVDELVKFYNKKLKLEEKIYTLVKEKNVILLLRSIAHKLNNKLSPIIGYTQLLQMKVSDENVLNKLNKIVENAEKAVNIVSLMMEHFKPITVEKEVVDINEIIKRTLYLLSSKFKNLHVKLDLNLSDDIPKIIEEISYIEDIILNLITNAIEAVEKIEGERRISVTTYKEEELIYIVVSDNGKGMAENELRNIFEPFYSTKPDGKGLGLNMVHGIVQTIGGNINVDSKPNQGTTVKVWFPYTPEEKVEHEKEKIKKVEAHGDILIVDDDVYIVELAKEILNMYAPNLSVEGVTSGEKAKELIEEKDYDLIVSDIKMPEFSGIDLYNYLKSLNKHEKIIFITGDPYSKNVKEFLVNENIEYIKKPFSIMEFSDFVLNKLKNLKEV